MAKATQWVAASQFVANGPQSLELPAGVVNVYHVVERGQFVGCGRLYGQICQRVLGGSRRPCGEKSPDFSAGSR